MTKPRTKNVELIAIPPEQIYRTNLSEKLFGYGPESVRLKIRSGELPMPFPLSPSARFEAWTGQQILDHRKKMQDLAAAKSMAERPKQEQPKALREARIKKQKLRRAKTKA